MRKLVLNHQVKEENGFLSSSRGIRFERGIFFLLTLLLPTQFGKHFWPDFSFLLGLRIDYLSPTLYVSDGFVISLFFLWLTRKKIPSKRSLILYFSAVLYLVVTVFLNGHIVNGLLHVLKFLEISFIAYYIATTIATIEQVRKIAAVFSLGVIGEAILALSQYLIQSSVGGLFYFFGERAFTASTPGIANASLGGTLVLRPYGTFSHPNVLAGYLLISMTIIVFVFLHTKYSLTKLLYATALLIGTAGLFVSLSRIAILLWVGILIGIGVWWFGKFLTKNKAAIFAACVGVLIFIVLFWSPLGNRFSHLSLADESIVQREMLLSVSWKLFLAHPLLGIGFGNFLPFLSKDSFFASHAFLQPVHNIFFLVATETGTIGILLFVFFLLKTFQHLLRQIKTDKERKWFYYCCGICLTSISVIGQFDHYSLTLQQGQLLFAYVVGLCWMDSRWRR